MCDHALPGMCEHALPTWSEVIRDPSDFKEETLLHVLADDVILKIDTIPLPAFRTFKVVYPKYPCTTIVRKVPDGKLSKNTTPVRFLRGILQVTNTESDASDLSGDLVDRCTEADTALRKIGVRPPLLKSQMKLYSSDKDRIFKGKQRFEDLYNWCRIGECILRKRIENKTAYTSVEDVNIS